MSTVPTIDDIQCDIWHLYHLIDALAEHVASMDHARDGKLDPAMCRASALAWIARDAARRIAGDTDNLVDTAATESMGAA